MSSSSGSSKENSRRQPGTSMAFTNALSKIVKLARFRPAPQSRLPKQQSLLFIPDSFTAPQRTMLRLVGPPPSPSTQHTLGDGLRPAREP